MPLLVMPSDAIIGSAAGRPKTGSGILDSSTGSTSTGISLLAGGILPERTVLAPLAMGVVPVKTPRGGANENAAGEAAVEVCSLPEVPVIPSKVCEWIPKGAEVDSFNTGSSFRASTGKAVEVSEF